MGNSESKNQLHSELGILRKERAVMYSTLDLATKHHEEALDRQKDEFERKYEILRAKYSELERKFIRLKCDIEEDGLTTSNLVNHANNLEHKLQATLAECTPENSFTNISENSETFVKYYKKLEENIRQDSKIKLNRLNVQHQQEIEKMREIQLALKRENETKDIDLQKLKSEIQILKAKLDSEKQDWLMHQENKRLLLCENYEKEKQEIHLMWEDKLNEKLLECNNQINAMDTAHKSEQVLLTERYEKALKDIEILSKRCALSNRLFEEMRARYNCRESRKEDLEKIAELEGELIIQAEELEKQRYLVKQLKRKPEFKGSKSTKFQKVERQVDNNE